MSDYAWLLPPLGLVLLIAYLAWKKKDGNWHEAGDGTMTRVRNGRSESRPMRAEEIKRWQDEQW